MRATSVLAPLQKGSKTSAKACKWASQLMVSNARKLNTHRHFADSESLVLVLAGTPLHGEDEALPDALYELGIGQGLVLLLALDRGDDLHPVRSARVTTCIRYGYIRQRATPRC